MDYQEFLESKKITVKPCGISVPRSEINPMLFDFQIDIVKWALAKGKAATFAGTGLGKTGIQLEWGNQVHKKTGGDVLILAPLAVAQQTVREGQKFGITVTLCRSQEDVQSGLNITNYEMLHKFDPDKFIAVVLDECFPGNTLIDVIQDNQTIKKQIKDIKIGDQILNACGVDLVSDVHRREVKYAVKLTINGNSIICSPNHPYLTRRGWVGAQDLIPGDKIMATSQAMRMVREGIYGQICSSCEDKILREILLSEMADASARNKIKSTQPNSGCKKGQETFGMVEFRESESRSRERKNPETKSNVRSCCEKESLPPIESHEPQTFRAWGQWDWFNSTSKDFIGCTWERLDSGICFVTGKTDSRLSNALQARLSKSRAENRYRSGWKLSSCKEGSRQEEGYEIGFSRVESLEVLEPGHPELEQYREQNGRIYFYDLGATRHPSFSVNGLLVHNSSILKSFTGKVRTQIIEMFQHTPYKLACTATPAPNDHMELCNHAEFLGVMTRAEMLAMFFVHDGGKTSQWRLKNHAREMFWTWVASWAVMLSKPSDLGYVDGGFILPPLNINHVTVLAEGPEAKTMTERREARKNSIVDRCHMLKAIMYD
jgi:hypothetical protein